MFGFHIERDKRKHENQNGEVQLNHYNLYDTLDSLYDEDLSEQEEKKKKEQRNLELQRNGFEALKMVSIIVLVALTFMFRSYYMGPLISGYYEVEKSVTGAVDEHLIGVDKRQGIVNYDKRKGIPSSDAESKNIVSQNGISMPNIQIRGSVKKKDGEYAMFKYNNKIYTLKQGDIFDGITVISVMKNGMEVRDSEGNEFRFYQE